MLIQYFKNAIKTTNENFLVVLPLIGFFILMHLYLILTIPQLDSLIKLCITMLTLLFMTAVFLAGWFYMIRQAINLTKQVFVLDDHAVRAHIGLIKEFPTGVGKFFLSYLGQIIISFFLFLILSAVFYIVCTHFIGEVTFTPEQIAAISKNPQNYVLNTLSVEQSVILAKWGFCFSFFSFICSYLVMFWAPEITYGTTNPFAALFKSIKKLFRKPLKSFALFVILNLFSFILSLLMSISSKFLFAYFFFAMFYLYFIVYVIIVVFSYYENEFVSQDIKEEN